MSALSISSSHLQNIFGIGAIIVAIATATLGAVTALRTGFIKSLSFGGITFEMGLTKEQIEALGGSAGADKVEKPFEVVALSNYYNHALRRANVSFWFSIVFASVGFGVILFAFITHNRDDVVGTIVKAASGAIIDAVASLFFVQSTAAQKSMADFFEKLRLDRLNAEARSIIAEIESPVQRDQLRAQLVLKYAGIDKLLVGG